MKPFQTSWETDDGELSVSLVISERGMIEVTATNVDDGLTLATAVSDIDEMIDILLRCKRIVERRARGIENPTDEP